VKTLLTGAERERRFIEFYERFYDPILSYARRRTDDAQARDVAAETFLTAWRRLDQALEGELPWLYRTAHLTLQNAVRSHSRGLRVVRRLESLPLETGRDHADAVAERSVLLQAIGRLSQTDQELLFLTTWEGLEVREAAKVVGCSPGAAAARLHRSRKTLREYLVHGGSQGQPSLVTTREERS
jgi:RNA polymerase sigma-70 factor (ECF subfamily)